ncbi:hypothetical protein MBAV_002986 [Candidatus Magnetobacterium bavaricum]|uniref:DUF262 domain-containing protein n=1 Tax=Candidatus Magnetobacterium bavaricum TaxID=29290 RepID=A0A0F3GSI0_9BACT|nr:hypothetical protein MBAV_002986 [Candidatus Magnetobacterium bavaricum]
MDNGGIELIEDYEEYPISEYDLTSIPNDFTITTLVHLIDSGIVQIPGFQRNYVWDIQRASKLMILTLKNNLEFIECSTKHTTNTDTVFNRLELSSKLIS